MNILYIGNINSGQNDGWAVAARRYCQTLTLNNNVKAAHFNMSNSSYYTTPILEKLKSNRFNTYDIVIQNVLPHFFFYDGRIPVNLGLCYLETSNLEYNNWSNRFKLMDGMITCSQKEKREISKYNKNVHNINIPIDHTIANKQYPQAESIKHTDNTFLFYFIGSFSSRKNLNDLATAFLLEFSSRDNVALVIKTHNIDAKRLQENIEALMKTLRIFNRKSSYPRIYTITDNMAEDQLYGLHQSCDCFVLPSHGESFCIPLYDAMVFNNSIICTRGLGASEGLDNAAWLIDSNEDYVICDDPPINSIYTGREKWLYPQISSLMSSMRETYSNKELRESKKQYYPEIINKLSYSTTANKLQKCLEEFKP